MAKFDMYDAWHKMDDDYVSGVDLQAKGQEQLSNTKVNPLHDLAESVTEWIGDMDKAGQKLAVAAGEAYKTGNFDAIDDMSLPDVDAPLLPKKRLHRLCRMLWMMLAILLPKTPSLS